jgi:mono/diheme cytochrome c family protein
MNTSAKTLIAATLMLLTTVAITGCRDTAVSVNASAASQSSHAGRVERGKYLVSVIGCNDCHTPLKMGPKGPEPDMDRFLSGHPEQIGPLPATKTPAPYAWSGAPTMTAFSGPWGVSYAANITPDQNTGLGIWTEDMFVRALRTGRHMGTSREIMPPMPWPAFRNATDEDLKSIYAYLRTIKPVTNHVPDVQPAPELAH